MTMEFLIVFWIVVLVATILIEFATFNLVTVWFAVGSIAALILAAFDVDVLIQFFVFLTVSGVLLLLVRPLTKKFMKTEIVRTNLDRVVGMIGTITVAVVPNELGEVRVNGMLWKAYCPQGLTYNEGERVEIKAITGTRLVIAKAND